MTTCSKGLPKHYITITWYDIWTAPNQTSLVKMNTLNVRKEKTHPDMNGKTGRGKWNKFGEQQQTQCGVWQ